MAKQGEKEEIEESHGPETRGNLQHDIDALFALPLAEFTPARNALAARLKKSGRREEAECVKALAKPSISAWAVNQLYWKHRQAFDQLIATGERFRQSQFAGKIEITESGNARRKALSDLSRQAAALLLEAGHNAAPDLIRRVAATLEAISAYASLTGASPPGRLTQDLNPPGFEALAALIPDDNITERIEKRSDVISFQGSRPDQPEVTSRARIAAAEVSLSNAKRALNEAQAKAQAADFSLEKAVDHAKDADKRKREAEERLQRAIAISEEAGRRARDAAAEARDAATTIENAARAVEKASDELQALLRESPESGR